MADQSKSADHPAVDYLNDLFKPGDLLYLAYIHRDKKAPDGNNLIRNFAMPVERLTEERAVGAITKENADWNVYVSMATYVSADAGRKKSNIRRSDHVFIEIDDDGPKHLAEIQQAVADGIIPQPTYVIESSPAKFHVIWNVRASTVPSIETLNRALVACFGADPISTDAGHLLRLPGFKNVKPKYGPDSPTVTVVQRNVSAAAKLSDFKIEIQTTDVSQELPAIPESELTRRVELLSGALVAAQVGHGGFREWSGGYVTRLDRCPWNPEARDDGHAYVGVQTSGALFFGCYHSDCNGKKWDDFRAWMEQKAGRRLKLSDVLDPKDPLATAREFIARGYTRRDTPTLVHQNEVFFRWLESNGVYAELEAGQMRHELYEFLQSAKERVKTDGGKIAYVPFKPTKARVEWVKDALRAVANLSTDFQAPSWLRNGRDVDPLDLLACRNGLLHIPTGKLLDRTPDFYAVNGVDFDFDPRAPEPTKWLRFLKELWPDADDESTDVLQEMTGYNLTPRTHLQKIECIIGPPRSGKGTIGRIMRRLCGERNSCAPTLAALGMQFGMSVLIDKTLAVISDARVGRRTDTAAVVERMLAISGEDAQTIPRKFLPDWNGKLSTRFLFLSNELPWIEDSSGAFVSRFIILKLVRSFLGEEDPTLFDNLVPELPGILNWAVHGWKRLQDRGYFIPPKESTELVKEFSQLSSPITAFLEDECEIGSGFTVGCDDLYERWKTWCVSKGREKPGAMNIFTRNLRAVKPELKTERRRDGDKILRHWEGIKLLPKQW